MFGLIKTGIPSERSVDEAKVVVAYLYNFGKFIDWPATAFTSPETPMRLCLYGDNSLGHVTDMLKNKRLGGRPVDVLHIKRGGSLDGCHVLYIDASERFYIRPLLNLTREMPLLTVSEIDGFAAAGGIIGLVYANNKLKFEINSAAAAQAHLDISSQLLKLAINLFKKLPQ